MFITHNYTRQHIMKLDTCGIERLPREVFFFLPLVFCKINGACAPNKTRVDLGKSFPS